MDFDRNYNLPKFVINHIKNAVQKQFFGMITYRFPVNHIVDLRRYDPNEVQRCANDYYRLLIQAQ